MTKLPTMPKALEDADCDTASGGASTVLMGITRIVVSKPLEDTQLTEFGQCACKAAKESVTPQGPVFPGAWET